MAALVELLDRTPVRRRTRAVAAAGAAVVVAAGITGAVAFSRETRAAVRCEAAGDGIAALWTPEARGNAHPSVAAALDLHATRWRDVRVEACRATHERGEQSADLLDRRMRCLDRQLDTTRAMLGAVDTGSADALDALGRLPDPRACNAARLATVVPLPDDPRVAEIQRQLDAIIAARTAGDEAKARGLVDGALATADALAHPGLRANVLWEKGNLLAGLDPAASKSTLEEALREAIAAGDVELEASAMDDLLILAVDRGEVPPIEAMLPLAQATHRRDGVSAQRRGQFHMSESRALTLLGRHDDALAACDHLGEVEDAPQVYTTACRCHVLFNAGRDALAACREAADVAEATYGPEHPNTATRLGALSNATYRTGDYAASLALEERVLAIREKAFGPESAEVAHILFSLTTTYRDLGRFEDSKKVGERSLAIFEKLGLTAWAAKVHGGLGQTMSRLKDPKATVFHADEALRLNIAALGADHPDMALNYGIHAIAHAEVGNDAIAVNGFARCAEVAAASYGPTHPLAGQCALAEAEALVNLGRFREAVAKVEHVMATADTAGFRKENLPGMKEILGRALWGAGEKKRARKALDEALAGFREIGDEGRAKALEERMRGMR
jgi:tetratricopeptide (TPR) repeat protein